MGENGREMPSHCHQKTHELEEPESNPILKLEESLIVPPLDLATWKCMLIRTGISPHGKRPGTLPHHHRWLCFRWTFPSVNDSVAEPCEGPRVLFL